MTENSTLVTSPVLSGRPLISDLNSMLNQFKNLPTGDAPLTVLDQQNITSYKSVILENQISNASSKFLNLSNVI